MTHLIILVLFAHSVMSDNEILFGDIFSQCYGRIVLFVCNINQYFTKLQVGNENCVKSFEKVNKWIEPIVKNCKGRGANNCGTIVFVKNYNFLMRDFIFSE